MIAAWQFEKEPKVTVPPDVIDDPALMIQSGYEPSEAQQAENSRAKAKERLLTWVWDDNRMHEKLLAAAKTGLFQKLVCMLGFITINVAVNLRLFGIHRRKLLRSIATGI